jgi:hypothetical protein
VVGTSAPAGPVGSSPRNDRPALLEQPEAQPPCPPRGILGPTSAQQARYPAATPPIGVQPATYTQSAAPWPAGSQGPPPGGPMPQAYPPGSQWSPEPWDRDQPGAQPPGGSRGILDPITAPQAWYPAPTPPAGTPPATYTQPVRPAEARTELPAIDQRQLPGAAITTDADSSTHPRPSIQRLGAEGLPSDTAQTPATLSEAPGLGAEGQKAIAEGPPLATQTIETPVEVVPPRAEEVPSRPLQPNLALPDPMPLDNPGLVADGPHAAGVGHKVVVPFLRPAVGAVCGWLALAVLVAFGRTLRYPRKAISPRRPRRRPVPRPVPLRRGGWTSRAWRKVAEKVRAGRPRRRPVPRLTPPKRSGWTSWAWRKVAKKLRPETPRRRPLPRLVPLRRCG